jgi:hypothetical protein
MRSLTLISGVIICVSSFSGCGSGSSGSNGAPGSVAGDGAPLSSDQKTSVLNIFSAMNRTQAAPSVIKPAKPNGDTTPSASPSSPVTTDATLQRMENNLEGAKCDVSWSQTPDPNDSTNLATSFQHQTDSFKVSGAHCPISFSDVSTTNNSADSTLSDFDDETSYTVLDSGGFGKLNDVVGWMLSTKLHSTFSAPSAGSQHVTGNSGTFSGQIISSTLGSVALSGSISSNINATTIHMETRLIFKFPSFQAVLRDEQDSPMDGNGQTADKEYLNGVQLSQDEVNGMQGK